MTTRTVTIDPLSPTPAVEDPEIKEALDAKTGDFFDTVRFIKALRYDKYIELRAEIREHLHTEKNMYECAECFTPVYLISSKNKRVSFRHTTENGSCRAITRGILSQDEINARKYNGLRESEAHKRIKRQIERSLLADPSFRNIVLEATWRSSGKPKSFRRPDVRAEVGSGKIVFEAQLSTTFLTVVVGRRVFYRDENALLVWVMARFSPNDRTQMADDLIFTNNSNVLIVDEETARISEERHNFHVRCHYRRPLRDKGGIIDQWEEQIVSFHDLTCDVEAGKAYFFDYAGAEKSLRAELAFDAENQLRAEFFVLWEAPEKYDADLKYRQKWDDLRTTLEHRNIAIPLSPNYSTSFRNLINSILSAKSGAPVGWKFNQLIQVAHHIANQSPENVLAFGYAVKHFGRDGLIKEQDRSGKWNELARTIKLALAKYDPQYMPSEEFLAALLMLFPIIGQKILGFFSKIESQLADTIE